MRCVKKPFIVLLLAVLLAALAAGCSAAARKARYQARADNYFNAGQYPQAEIEYLNVLKLDRQNAHAIGQLGLVYFDEGRLARAYTFLTKGLELDPTNQELRLKAGFIYLATGQAEKARDAATTILNQSPGFPQAPLLLAESARTRTAVAEIRKRLEQLAGQPNTNIWIELGLGTLDSREGKIREAEARFKRALRLDPKSSAACSVLGLLYWAGNDLTNANLWLKESADYAPPRSAYRLQYANFKIRTGEVEQGKELLTKITKATPDYLPAWISLAEVALAQTQYDNCGALLHQALLRDPDNYQALMLDARLKLSKGETDQAIVAYEHLAATFKDSPQVFYQWGLACLVKGDSNSALKNFDQAVTLDPHFDAALLLQAQLNVRRGNAGSAITAMSQLIQRRPRLARAYLLLASAYIAKDNLDDALATYRRLGKLYPKNPQVPLLMGIILLRQNKTEDARKAFEASADLAPDYLPALEQLVRLEIVSRQYDTALGRIRARLEKTPKSPGLHFLLAQVLAAKKDDAQAVQTLKNLIQMDAKFEPAYLLLAQLYVDSKKDTEALQELATAISNNPRNTAALMLMAVIQNRQKDYSAARDSYEKLLAVNPDFGPALNNLAVLYADKLNLLDKGYAAARKARDLMPSDPSCADTLGWILFRRGEYTQALSLLRESAQKLPEQSEVLYHLGMAYYMLDDETQAQETLQRALVSGKEFSGRENAKRHLAVLTLDAKTAGAQAITELEKQRSEQTNDPVVLSRLAALYQRQGLTDKALKAYQAALSLCPQNANLTLQLALLYATQLHDSAKALDLARDAYKLAPDDPQVTYALGRLAFQSGDHKWALSLFQRSVQKQPENPELLYDLAIAYYSVGRVADARTAMQRALHTGKDFSRTDKAKQFLELVDLPSDPARATQAEPELRAVLQQDPGSVPALMAIAAAQEHQNDPRAAASNYKHVLRLYPDFVLAIKRLAILDVEKLGDDQQGYDLALKARRALPDDAAVAKALGIVLYRRSDFRGAATLLQAAAAKNPDAQTFYYLGMSQYRLKNSDASRDSLRRALNLNISPELAAEAQRILKELR